MAETLFDPAHHLVLECEATRHFVGILQREQFALQHTDISSLDLLSQEKTRHLEQLAGLGEARHEWLASHGHSADREGMETGLRNHPGADELWRDLLALAEAAMQLNKVNGLLIDRHLRYNQQRLRAVHAAIQPVNLYGSDGQTQTIRPTRQLGEG